MNYISNAFRLLRQPQMIRPYAAWLIGSLFGEPTLRTLYGSRLSSFHNFSNYWSTLSKIPSAAQFEYFGTFLRPPHETCFDIGANIGSISILLGKLKRNATIHAFEPVPATFAALLRNIQENNLQRVHPHQLAFTDREEMVLMTNDQQASQKNKISTAVGESDGRLITVRATSIDKFCEIHDYRYVGFVKIDVEGAEPKVLQGARKMLSERRIKCLLVEFAPMNLSSMGSSIAALIDILKEFPYEIRKLTFDGFVGEKVDLQTLGFNQSEDYLLLPRP